MANGGKYNYGTSNNIIDRLKDSSDLLKEIKKSSDSSKERDSSRSKGDKSDD
tara:strand:- start:23 stop:178 length:156 start_codon:yes stop_codon:yes gene_type:complete